MVPILFDLEGALVDPLPGVSATLAALCAAQGLPLPVEDRIPPHLGSGLRALLAELIGEGEGPRIESALESFWGRFEAAGLPALEPHPGISLLLPRLRRHGHALHALTSMPTSCARRLLHQLDLLLDFDEVLGTGLQGDRPSRAGHLAHLAAQGIELQGGCLVSSTAADFEAARGFGLRPLGVGYAHSDRAALEAAGAERCFGSVAELDDWLAREYPGPEIHDITERAE